MCCPILKSWNALKKTSQVWSRKIFAAFPPISGVHNEPSNPPYNHYNGIGRPWSCNQWPEMKQWPQTSTSLHAIFNSTTANLFICNHICFYLFDDVFIDTDEPITVKSTIIHITTTPTCTLTTRPILWDYAPYYHVLMKLLYFNAFLMHF